MHGGGHRTQTFAGTNERPAARLTDTVVGEGSAQHVMCACRSIMRCSANLINLWLRRTLRAHPECFSPHPYPVLSR